MFPRDAVDDLYWYYKADARTCAKENGVGKHFQSTEAFKVVRLVRYEVFNVSHISISAYNLLFFLHLCHESSAIERPWMGNIETFDI